MDKGQLFWVMFCIIFHLFFFFSLQFYWPDCNGRISAIPEASNKGAELTAGSPSPCPQRRWPRQAASSAAAWGLALHPRRSRGAQMLHQLPWHKTLPAKRGHEERVRLLTPPSIPAPSLEPCALQNVCHQLCKCACYGLGEPLRRASATWHVYAGGMGLVLSTGIHWE